jgi:uncharacterized protein YhfF
MWNDTIENYWRDCAAALAGVRRLPARPFSAEQFGDSPEMADELGALIVKGTKTATCSALWEWEAEGQTPPTAGVCTVVLDGSGAPLCVIETTEVSVVPFDEVDAAFARDEGEGDRSLEYWREAHWRFFSRALPKFVGREPSPDMPLVCERFRLLYV